jgi:hypothetical protein
VRSRSWPPGRSRPGAQTVDSARSRDDAGWMEPSACCIVGGERGWDDARRPDRPRRGRGDRAREAPRLPARPPRRHGARLDVALLDELGLGDRFRALPHRAVDCLEIPLPAGGVLPIDLGLLNGPYKHVAMVPQCFASMRRGSRAGRRSSPLAARAPVRVERRAFPADEQAQWPFRSRCRRGLDGHAGHRSPLDHPPPLDPRSSALFASGRWQDRSRTAVNDVRTDGGRACCLKTRPP